MRFQVLAEIEHRRGKRSFLVEKQRDQQTADSSVAILERVQQLELPMHHGHLDQRVQIVAREITLEGFEMVEQLQRRRRHERRLIDRELLGPSQSCSTRNWPGYLSAPRTLSRSTACMPRISDKVKGRSARASVARLKTLR